MKIKSFLLIQVIILILSCENKANAQIKIEEKKSEIIKNEVNQWAV